MLEMLPLNRIRTDGGTQSRAMLQQDVVDEYAELMKEAIDAGQENPFRPLKVVYDGENYWLVDGFHRLAAATKAGLESFNCEIIQGNQRDAVLMSVGVNADHGLRRTNADKQRSVDKLLRDPDWGKWTDTEIARHAKVTHKTVTARRNTLEASGEIPQYTVRRTADGRDLDTSKIKASNEARAKPRDPEHQPDRTSAASGTGGAGAESRAASPPPTHTTGAGTPSGAASAPTVIAAMPLNALPPETAAESSSVQAAPTSAGEHAFLLLTMAWEFARLMVAELQRQHDEAEQAFFEAGKEADVRYDREQLRAAAQVFVASPGFTMQIGLLALKATITVDEG